MKIKPGLLGVRHVRYLRVDLWYVRKGQRSAKWDEHVLRGILCCESDPDFAETAWAHAREQVLRLRQDRSHPHPYVGRLVVKSGSRISFLKVCDIDWIEANGDYVNIHCDKRSYLLRKTLNDLADRLGGEGFSRISQRN